MLLDIMYHTNRMPKATMTKDYTYIVPTQEHTAIAACTRGSLAWQPIMRKDSIVPQSRPRWGPRCML